MDRKGKMKMGRAKYNNDWYWACASDAEPAGDKFIVENGQSRLWPRVRMEIDKEENWAWNHVHRADKGAHIEDILDLMLTVVPAYRINHNKFVFESAKIPVLRKVPTQRPRRPL